MARLDRDQMLTAATEHFQGAPDDTGAVDLTSERGSIIVAAEVGEMKAAFKRIKKIPGYRWVMINREDLFAANSLSIGSKSGIVTPDGTVLKNADIPRRKV